MDGTVFSTGQVAKLFECSTGTIIKRADVGDLKFYRVPHSRHRRYTRVELLRYANATDRPDVIEKLRGSM